MTEISADFICRQRKTVCVRDDAYCYVCGKGISLGEEALISRVRNGDHFRSGLVHPGKCGKWALENPYADRHGHMIKEAWCSVCQRDIRMGTAVMLLAPREIGARFGICHLGDCYEQAKQNRGMR